MKNPYINTAVVLGLGVILGFVIPNSNMELFKRILIDRKYKNYDTSWQIQHYENDYKKYQNECEFCVGRYYNSDKVRLKIKKNFKVSLIVIALSVLLTAIITIVLYTA